MLNSDRLKFRYFENKDLEDVMKIRSSSQAYDFFFEYEPFNKEQQFSWWQQSYKQSNEKNFIIVDHNDVFVGTVSLVNIDMRSKKAELGRFFINEHNRKNGIGMEAMDILIHYAFNHLNLNKIYLEVFSKNTEAVALYEKLGFTNEGSLKNHVFKNGEYLDVEIYSIFINNSKG
ncbi:MAG: UDP-4-amino-4,6-dideoxy-N-acetyl-beta-L-altrosamine N-acetyltransferase [Campylobacterota bacterium]|nr:UDP-4-amino-4,6-dideoxy-N-acetyl-beta-L-altrosamine N-acetyltransferase [Campylobacterota bacterium]